MLRSRLAFALIVPLAMIALVACGRTPGLGSGADGGIQLDQWPRPDQWRRDFRPPPPPDFRLPPDAWRPPPDFYVWPDFPRRDGPPPPPDFGPWPDFPRPPDFGPPPDGPQPDLPPNCNPSCAELCKVAGGMCGIYPVDVCIKECSIWTPTQTKCVALQYCNFTMPPDCSAVKTCLVPPTQLPDLTVKLSAMVAGDVVTYTLSACNAGAGFAGTYFVDVYYDQATPPGQQQFGDQFQQYSGLAPGACQQTTFTRTGTPAGTYASWAQVDADAQVTETNESNNVSGPFKLTVQGPPPPVGPDLVINSVTTTVTGSAATTVRYRINICNKGQTASGSTQVHVYYNRPGSPQPLELGDQFTTVPALQPAACTNRDIVRSGTPPGTYNSWAQVDPQDAVQESVETNNISGPHVVTVGSTQGADLRIDSFTAQVAGTSTVVYNVRVCNGGTGSSGSTDVEVYYNSPNPPPPGTFGDKLATIPQLGPGNCSNSIISRSGTPPGAYVSWARVDALNAVTETNEANNDGGPIKVLVNKPSPQPDLRITQFIANVAGSTVNYSLVVCNQGQANAGFSRVDLYHNRNGQPPAGLNGDQSSALAPLSAGSCQSVNLSRTNTPNGSYSSWSRVDRLDQVTESNESNNVVGPISVNVGGTPPPVNCAITCNSAIQCGLFSIVAFPQCLSWCAGLDASQQACVSKASNPLNCAALKSCAPIPPPPPPPPPGFCSNLCGWLQSPCNLLPAGQQLTCQSVCSNLTPAQVTCAQNAQAAGQCLNALFCVFN